MASLRAPAPINSEYAYNSPIEISPALPHTRRCAWIPNDPRQRLRLPAPSHLPHLLRYPPNHLSLPRLHALQHPMASSMSSIIRSDLMSAFTAIDPRNIRPCFPPRNNPNSPRSLLAGLGTRSINPLVVRSTDALLPSLYSISSFPILVLTRYIVHRSSIQIPY